MQYQRYIRYWLTVVCLMFAQVVLAQEWYLVLQGGVWSQNDDARLEGAEVKVMQNNADYVSMMTDEKGSFEVRLAPDAEYLVVFSHPDYVSKRLSFKTTNVPSEATPGGDFNFRFDITLFKKMEGLDVSILNQPLVEVHFDPQSMDFNYNREYTLKMKGELEKLQGEIEKRLKD